VTGSGVIGYGGDRRRPVATLVLIGLILVAFVGFGRGVNPAGGRIRAAEDAVWRHWTANPWLELDPRFVSATVSPIWRRTVGMQLEARRAGNPTGAATEPGAVRQALDDLTTTYFATVEAHPYRRWGLVPARPRPIGATVGLLLFPSLPAMLIGVGFLLLAGPPLERAAGRIVVAGLYVAGAVFGLLVPALLFPSSWWPVVGAAGGVASVLGGATAWFAGGEVPIVTVRRDRVPLTVPAALFLPCWLGLTMLVVVLTPPADGRHCLSLSLAVALGAALGSFSRRRGRVPTPAAVPAIPDLVEGLELLAAGETARARDALQRMLADDPGQADANFAMWQSYLQDGMPGQGAEHLVRVIEADLRRREPERAWEHWQELLTRSGTAGPAALRWRIAGARRAVDPVRPRDDLPQLADDVTAGIASEKARHRLAAEPPAAAATGVAAEAPPQIGGVVPAAARRRRRRGRPRGRESAEAQDPRGGGAPAAARGVLLEQLQSGGLVLRGENGQTRLLAYRDLEAIAGGGIAEASKPYVVLDLLTVAEPGRARRLCRLLSTRFDPRRFVGQAGLTPMEAFRELVRVIAGASGARLLPGPEALQRIPVFPTQEAYEREVLGLAPRS
jgi:hypothetical protein